MWKQNYLQNCFWLLIRSLGWLYLRKTKFVKLSWHSLFKLIAVDCLKLNYFLWFRFRILFLLDCPYIKCQQLTIVSVHTAPQRTVTVLACNASFIAMGIILNSLSMKGLNNQQHIFYSGPNCPPLFQCIWSGALLI